MGMAAAGRARLRPLLALVALLLPLAQAGVPQIPKVWTVMGPFPLGMRELGADPLAAFAGDWWARPDATFPSEIADGGHVGLSSVQTAADGRTVGPIVFEEPRWSFNREFWGWAFNQWQGWARGEFHVDEAGAFLVRCQNIGEFFVDDQCVADACARARARCSL